MNPPNVVAVRFFTLVVVSKYLINGNRRDLRMKEDRAALDIDEENMIRMLRCRLLA
jgi:hypothetical protein